MVKYFQINEKSTINFSTDNYFYLICNSQFNYRHLRGKIKKILTRFRMLFSGRLPIQAPCPEFGDQHHKTPKKNQNKEIQNYNTHF